MDKFSPAMDSVHESFTDEQITEFQEAFNLFPQEQKGHIELELLETALKSLGHHPTQVISHKKLFEGVIFICKFRVLF